MSLTHIIKFTKKKLYTKNYKFLVYQINIKINHMK
jgi:hypothetical protein